MKHSLNHLLAFTRVLLRHTFRSKISFVQAIRLAYRYFYSRKIYNLIAQGNYLYIIIYCNDLIIY